MSLGNRFSYPETEEKVFTIRQPQSALLLIDSRDRAVIDKTGTYPKSAQNGTYNNYRISNQKLTGFGEIKRIGVSEVLFPWLTPNVNPYTQLLVITGYSGLAPPAPRYISYYILLTEGFYSASSIADPDGFPGTGPLANQLNENLKYVETNAPATFGAETWTVFYDNKLRNIIISNLAVEFAITTVPVGQGNLNGSTGLDTLLGLTTYQFETLTDDRLTNQTIGGYPSMTYTQYIDVCSNALCKFQKLRDSLTQFTYTNIICRIYLASPTNMSSDPFGISPCPSFTVKYPNMKWIEWNPDQMIGEIDIQYFDDSGNPLYIPVGAQDSAQQLFSLIMSDS